MDYDEECIEDLQEVKHDNLSLKKKLEMMQKIQSKMLNETKKMSLKVIAPTSLRRISSKGLSESHMSSARNLEMITEHKKYREKLNEQRKAEIELKNCTFKPKINKVSESLIQSSQYVPVFERPLPEKKPDPKPVEEMEEAEEESDSREENKVKKKMDPDFYKRQLEWKQQMEERRINERLAKQLDEYESSKPVPKTNKNKNEKLLSDKPKFIDRMKQDMEKSKVLKEQLDQKYNNSSFKPKINKNMPVKSIVAQIIRSPDE